MSAPRDAAHGMWTMLLSTAYIRQVPNDRTRPPRYRCWGCNFGVERTGSNESHINAILIDHQAMAHREAYLNMLDRMYEAGMQESEAFADYRPEVDRSVAEMFLPDSSRGGGRLASCVLCNWSTPYRGEAGKDDVGDEVTRSIAITHMAMCHRAELLDARDAVAGSWRRGAN